MLAVLLWPRLGRPVPLGAAALAAGIAIELLQWALPLGRVVSPLDALLNATGAPAVGLLVARTRLGSVRVRAGVLAERAGEQESRRHVPR